MLLGAAEQANKAQFHSYDYVCVLADQVLYLYEEGELGRYRTVYEVRTY